MERIIWHIRPKHDALAPAGCIHIFQGQRVEQLQDYLKIKTQQNFWTVSGFWCLGVGI